MDLIKECIVNKNDDLLISLLNLIKAEFRYILSNDQYKQLVQLKSSIHDQTVKASFIECIASYEHFIFSEDLLEEYIKLIALGVTTDLKAKVCLEDMSVENVDNEKLYLKLVEFLEEEQAIRILVIMPQVKLDNVPIQLSQFSENLNIARRIHERSLIINSFLLIVHSQLNHYIDILDISMVYPSAESALKDWAIQTPKSAKALVNRKIFDENEANIFLKLGQEYLKTGYINSKLGKELYCEFFEQKSPIDVIFMLPN